MNVKRHTLRRYALPALLLGMLICFFFLVRSGTLPPANERDFSLESVILPPQFAYGFNLDSFDIDRFELEPNQFLGDILADRGVGYSDIATLTEVARNVYSVRKLRAGSPCAIVRRKGTGLVECFVYEPSPYTYVRYHIFDEPCVDIVERDVEVCIESGYGVIESSLWLSMENLGHQYALISRMEDALAWSVDFHHLQRGDSYKLLYEQKYIDGAPVGIGNLLGVSFQPTGQDPVYSVYFESDNYNGFFDEQGRPMKRAFLKAPVRYSRISSRYSLRRYHPILKRYKGHFGTDYAADYGTPIMAVADGTVTHAAYTRGNGNYIKIRHDDVYETQYLHMSRFATHMRAGRHVRQGEVIGYVGSTGLATGPHVCFRFWKNGRQVDHLRENLPPPDPMPREQMPEYLQVRDQIIPELESIQVVSLP